MSLLRKAKLHESSSQGTANPVVAGGPTKTADFRGPFRGSSNAVHRVLLEAAKVWHRHHMTPAHSRLHQITTHRWDEDIYAMLWANSIYPHPKIASAVFASCTAMAVTISPHSCNVQDINGDLPSLAIRSNAALGRRADSSATGLFGRVGLVKLPKEIEYFEPHVKMRAYSSSACPWQLRTQSSSASSLWQPRRHTRLSAGKTSSCLGQERWH